MRDAVIIGGGLSGLAAAYELTRQHVPFTLIEVKSRLGGSINTVHQGGFALDAGRMLHSVEDLAAFQTFLSELGLDDAVELNDTGLLLFKNGTGTLVDALAGRINAPIMQRMAVSTLGRLDDGRFSICMENGMLLAARALVMAVPACHAERMFYTLEPEISDYLLDYVYEHVALVSVGYAGAGDSLNMTPPPASAILGVARVNHSARVPDGGVLLQASLRFDPQTGPPADSVAEVVRLMDWPEPVVHLSQIWPESTPQNWQDAGHLVNMKAVGLLMPEGVALCGSDYVTQQAPPALDWRVRQGIEAARRIALFLSG